MRALAWIERFVDNPARSLPPRAWASRQIRAFVPARYVVAFDRSYPDISKLPPPAGKALARYKPLGATACQVLTTGKARALLQAFGEAGISPSENHASLSTSISPACISLPLRLPHGPALPDDSLLTPIAASRSYALNLATREVASWRDQSTGGGKTWQSLNAGLLPDANGGTSELRKPGLACHGIRRKSG